MWRVYPDGGCYDTCWLTGHWSTQAKVQGIMPRAVWHWGRDSSVINDPLGKLGCTPLYVGLCLREALWMMTLCFSPFCRSAPFWGIWQTYTNKQTSGSDNGVSLSIGTLIGNMEGAPLLGKMSFQGMGCRRFCRRGLSP